MHDDRFDVSPAIISPLRDSIVRLATSTAAARHYPLGELFAICVLAAMMTALGIQQETVL